MVLLRGWMSISVLMTAIACERDLLDGVKDGPGLRRAVEDFAQPGMSLDSARTMLESRGFGCEPEPAAGSHGVRCEQEGVRDDAVWRWAITLHGDSDQIVRIGTFVERKTGRRGLLRR